jgi:single-stranded-DNA-specific exonuclease
MAENGEIKGLKEVAKKIIETAKNHERVIIYADADLDGVASAIILKETLEILNPKYLKKNLKVYFPDRENEGYGITISALNFFQEFAPANFFALDCGITNFDEIELAKKKGFFVIVIDHHQVLEKLPKADLIINPKQPEDKYPFKQFSSAGLVYKLAKFVLNQNQIQWKPERFLELVALATLADQMPLVEENKELVKQGLLAFKYTSRLGLQLLKEITHFVEDDSIELFQKIIAPLNSSERIDHLTQTYLLLTTNSKKVAEILAKDLVKKTQEKKRRIQEIIEEIEGRIKEKNLPIIYEGDPSWPLVLIGIVASKICHKYKKPTFLFKLTKDEAICSARLPANIDGVKAMASCKYLLKNYGGHPPACGGRLKRENFEEFKKCLIDYFTNLKS